MLTLIEVRASGQVAYQLSGDVEDIRQLAEGLVASECAQIAAQVRQAASAPKTAVVAFKPGTSALPDALIDAAQRVGIHLYRLEHEPGPEESIDPKG